MRAKRFSWNEMPAERVTDLFSRKMVVGENEMLCWLELKPGCKVPRHSHIHEQISHCLRGRLRFDVDGEVVEIGPGETLLIPPHVPHSAEVVGEETVIDYDIFSPIRRDWLEGTDNYLRE
ncbi:MAG: cupin domain-containing protein [Nitrospinota bacterium]